MNWPRPFEIGLQETRILAPAATFAETFVASGALACLDIFEPRLFEVLLRQLEQASFVHEVVAKMGAREIEQPERTGNAIALMLSRPALLRWVEELAGTGPLARVRGRVVQARAGEDHALGWHNDKGMERSVAITIDLSAERFTGGDFELRRAGTQEMLTVHHHDAPGSALLFRVDHGLEHRVLPVLSGGPRRVFTGWFFPPE